MSGPVADSRSSARPGQLASGSAPFRITGGRLSAGRTARQVITLAGATFREAVRMKAFAAPVVFAATAAAASPFLPSDGTAAGAVRLAISVSLVTASIFGTFAAVMLPSLLAAREARDRTAYLVATKPVPGSAVFLGRALGISCVMGVTFAGMAALSWVFVRFTVLRESRRGGHARAEAAEVLVVRASLPPEWETGPLRGPVAAAKRGPRGSTRLAPGETARWRFSLPPLRPGTSAFEGRVAFADGSPPEALALRAINPRTGEASEIDLIAPTTVPAGHPERPHRFFVPVGFVDFDPENPRLPGTVDVEIKNRSPGPVELVKTPPVVILAGSYVSVAPGGTYRWQFRLGSRGRRRPAFRLTAHRDRPRSLAVALEFQGAGGLRVRRQVVLGTRPEAVTEVPAELVARDGFVTVELRNLSDRPVRIPAPSSQRGGGLVCAPPAGTFAGALARWTLLETCKAALIVIVTCAAATFLTFPVPALAGGTVAVGGYLMTFASRLLASAAGPPSLESYRGLVVPAGRALGLFLRLVLPDFARGSVSGRIADGAFVPAGLIATCAVWLVFVRGGVIGLIGAWLAGRREVGA